MNLNRTARHRAHRDSPEKPGGLDSHTVRRSGARFLDLILWAKGARWTHSADLDVRDQLIGRS